MKEYTLIICMAIGLCCCNGNAKNEEVTAEENLDTAMVNAMITGLLKETPRNSLESELTWYKQLPKVPFGLESEMEQAVQDSADRCMDDIDRLGILIGLVRFQSLERCFNVSNNSAYDEKVKADKQYLSDLYPLESAMYDYIYTVICIESPGRSGAFSWFCNEYDLIKIRNENSFSGGDACHTIPQARDIFMESLENSLKELSQSKESGDENYENDYKQARKEYSQIKAALETWLNVAPQTSCTKAILLEYADFLAYHVDM